METKVCSKCGQEKPFPFLFCSDRRLKSGYAARCKDCEKLYPRRHSSYRPQPYTGKYKEHEANYRRVYLAMKRATSPEYRAYKAEKDRQYRFSELGKITKKKAKYRRKNNGGTHNLKASEWKSILVAFGNQCAYCGSSENITIDHFIPLCKGGDTIKSNIVPACLTCNLRKQSKLPAEWCTADQFGRVTSTLQLL